MNIKNVVPALVLVGCLVSGAAQATILTWNFSGVLSISERAETTGLNINVGDSFNGSVTFENVLPNTNAAYNSSYGFVFQIGGHYFKSTGLIESISDLPLRFLQLGSTTGPAQFGPSGYATEAIVDGVQVRYMQPVIVIDGLEGSLPSDPSLINPVDWHWFQVGFESLDGFATSFFGGQLTFLSPSNPSTGAGAVPEPSSLVLLGLALFGLAASRQKRVLSN